MGDWGPQHIHGQTHHPDAALVVVLPFLFLPHPLLHHFSAFPPPFSCSLIYSFLESPKVASTDVSDLESLLSFQGGEYLPYL